MDESVKNEIQLFEDQKIRVAWDAEREEWYFSIVDVVGVLTDSPDYNTGRKYWNKLKQRLKLLRFPLPVSSQWAIIFTTASCMNPENTIPAHGITTIFTPMC